MPHEKPFVISLDSLQGVYDSLLASGDGKQLHALTYVGANGSAFWFCVTKGHNGRTFDCISEAISFFNDPDFS